MFCGNMIRFYIETVSVCAYVMTTKVYHCLLGSPAERQRSFSNAELSVVVRQASVRRPSGVNFSLKSLISRKLFDNFVQLRQQKRQRVFSNAELSVVVVVHSVSTFHLKAWLLKNSLITFFLFWHGTSLGRYQCTVMTWIWLNHFKYYY